MLTTFFLTATAALTGIMIVNMENVLMKVETRLPNTKSK